ncbi:MAG: hypothetical protein ACREBY_05370, partial [Polaromonas sp.]
RACPRALKGQVPCRKPSGHLKVRIFDPGVAASRHGARGNSRPEIGQRSGGRATIHGQHMLHASEPTLEGWE